MKLLVLLLFMPIAGFAQEEDTTICKFPDFEAHFPGGAAELSKFVSENIIYPDSVAYDFLGTIYFSFIVEKDGSITQVKNARSQYNEFNDTFGDLIRKMPKWIPAKVNGKIVRSRCMLPICINLK